MNQHDEAQPRNPQELVRAAEHTYHAWDEALGRKDLDAALALYAPDATIESPLVPHLLGSEVSICRGHDNLGGRVTQSPLFVGLLRMTKLTLRKKANIRVQGPPPYRPVRG